MIQLVPDFSIFVRHAVQDDAAVLARHLTLSEHEATQYRGSVLATSKEVAQTVALVAGVGTTVMGSLVATAASTTEWSINSVFVEAASRDIGIGAYESCNKGMQHGCNQVLYLAIAR